MHEPLILWRHVEGHIETTCQIEQIGEATFELRVFVRGNPAPSEPPRASGVSVGSERTLARLTFDDVGALLDAAEEFRRTTLHSAAGVGYTHRVSRP